MSYTSKHALCLCLLLSILSSLVSCSNGISPSATATPMPIPSKTLYVLGANEDEPGGAVRAYREADGALLWSVGQHAYAIAVDAGVVYILGQDALVAVDAQTGHQRWVGAAAPTDLHDRLASDNNMVSDVPPVPMVALGGTIVVSWQGTVYGYSNTDGSLRWRGAMPGTRALGDLSDGQLVVLRGQVYGWYGDTLVQLDPKDGTILWKRTFAGQDHWISHVEVTSDALIVTIAMVGLIGGETTVAVHARDGSQLWQITGAVDQAQVFGTSLVLWQAAPMNILGEQPTDGVAYVFVAGCEKYRERKDLPCSHQIHARPLYGKLFLQRAMTLNINQPYLYCLIGKGVYL